MNSPPGLAKEPDHEPSVARCDPEPHGAQSAVPAANMATMTLQEVVGEPTMTKEEADTRWQEQRRLLQGSTGQEHAHFDASTKKMNEADDDAQMKEEEHESPTCPPPQQAATHAVGSTRSPSSARWRPTSASFNSPCLLARLFVLASFRASAPIRSPVFAPACGAGCRGQLELARFRKVDC